MKTTITQPSPTLQARDACQSFILLGDRQYVSVSRAHYQVTKQSLRVHASARNIYIHVGCGTQPSSGNSSGNSSNNVYTQGKERNEHQPGREPMYPMEGEESRKRCGYVRRKGIESSDQPALEYLIHRRTAWNEHPSLQKNSFILFSSILYTIF